MSIIQKYSEIWGFFRLLRSPVSGLRLYCQPRIMFISDYISYAYGLGGFTSVWLRKSCYTNARELAGVNAWLIRQLPGLAKR